MDEKKDLLNSIAEQNPNNDPLPGVTTPAIRTYKSDINQSVTENKVNTAKILMAEQRKQQTQQVSETNGPVKKTGNVLALFFGVLFVLAGLGAVGYLGYTKIINHAQVAPIQPDSFFLFAFDSYVQVDATQSYDQVRGAVTSIIESAQSGKENTYTEIRFIAPDPVTKKDDVISSAQLFSLYNVRLPVRIGGAISKDYSYGLYKTGDRVEPFLVLALADYESAYDAMFDWEKTLAYDVQDFFPALHEYFNPVRIPEVSETTDTQDSTQESDETSQEPNSENNTTPSTATSVTPTSSISDTQSSPATSTDDTSDTPAPVFTTPVNRAPQFVDVVLSNRDTRAIRNDTGSPFFFYTFIERDKILFAQDSKLITEIGRKLREKQLVR